MKFLQRRITLFMASAIPVFKQTGLNLSSWVKQIRLAYMHFTTPSRDGSAAKEKQDIIAADCLQTIIDGLADDVMIISADYHIRQANSAMLRRLGMTPADIMEKACYKVSHGTDEPCCPPWCECPLNRVLETGESVSVVHTLPGNNADKDSEKWIEVVASPLRDGLGRVIGIIELNRDISESKKLRRAILRANRELLALNSIARALSQSLDLMITLQTAAETLLDALEAQISWVKLADENGVTPAVHANRGLSDKELDDLKQVVDNMGFGEQTTSATYSVVPNVGGGGADQLWQFAVTPLKLKGVVLGTAGVGTVKQPVDQQRVQLLDAIGHQIVAAVERCKLYGEVQLTRDLRGELLRKVIAAQEEERRRIARELHDETGQALTALRLCLERLAQVSNSNTSDEAKSRLAQSLNLCQQADEEIDKLIFDLRPSLLDDLGLVEAIEFFIQTRLTAAGIKASLKVIGQEKRLPSEREVALFRVMQEGINNIIRHAHAGSVIVHLEYKADHLEARIKDDGCGFEVKQFVSPQNSGSGLGLLGMKERMSLVGGSLSITSKAGLGTCIIAEVPLTGDGVKA